MSRRACEARGSGHGGGHGSAKPEIVDYLEEVFAPLGEVDSARLFGGWQLRAAGRPFAFVVKGTLYFRADGALRAEMAGGGQPAVHLCQGEAGRSRSAGS